MKITEILALILLLNPYVVFACDRPRFVDSVVAPLKASGVVVNEKHRQQPGQDTTCVYAATWRENHLDHEKLWSYIATYSKTEMKKIADLRYEIPNVTMYWDPTIQIDPTNFKIHPDKEAFGIRVSWGFMSGTFGVNDEQLDLIFPADGATLRSVLSLPINSEHYPRGCPGLDQCKGGERRPATCELCEEETARMQGIVIIGESTLMGYHDIIINLTNTTISSEISKHPEKKSQSTSRYRWDGEKYVTQ